MERKNTEHLLFISIAFFLLFFAKDILIYRLVYSLHQHRHFINTNTIAITTAIAINIIHRAFVMPGFWSFMNVVVNVWAHS